MDLLFVIDMQNDFCKPGGALYNPAAEAIIPNILKRCEEYDKREIVFTADAHFDIEREGSIEGKMIPKHCELDSKGAEIVDELKPFTMSRPVRSKYTFSFDWGSVWGIGNYRDYDAFEICGTCTDICVISNALALRSLFPGKRIIVHADCCAGTTPEAHEAALKVMESCLIEVVR